MATIGSILLITSANAKTINLKTINFKSIEPVTITNPILTNPLHSISVTDADGYLTNGTLQVISFTTYNGTLWAICKLKGIVGGIEIDEDCICPITVDPCDGIPPRLDLNATQPNNIHGCCVEIRFGSCEIRRVTGLSLNLNPHNVQCTVRDYSEHLLCTIHNTPRILLGQMVSLLNQLL